MSLPVVVASGSVSLDEPLSYIAIAWGATQSWLMACRPHIVIRKANCRFLVGGNCSRDAYHRMEWCQRIPFAFKLCSGSTAEVQMSFNHRPCARQAAAGTDVEVTSELIGAGGFAAKLKLESLSTWSDLV